MKFGVESTVASVLSIKLEVVVINVQMEFVKKRCRSHSIKRSWNVKANNLRFTVKLKVRTPGVGDR